MAARRSGLTERFEAAALPTESPRILGTEAGARAVIERFPSVDILINNLGTFEPKPFEQINDDDWRRFFEVNVMSGVRLSIMLGQ
jgi:NAD(P)-dependent dehydrogenase (short-subunit alcohol dehydrogenase family)